MLFFVIEARERAFPPLRERPQNINWGDDFLCSSSRNFVCMNSQIPLESVPVSITTILYYSVRVRVSGLHYNLANKKISHITQTFTEFESTFLSCLGIALEV